MTKSFFISHAEKDKELTQLIVDIIESEVGIREEQILFTSQIRYGFQSGLNWSETVFKHIREATFFVLVLTGDYFDSEFCTGELGAALTLADDESKFLIPIAISPDICPKSKLLQYKQCYGYEVDHIDTILSHIQQYIGKSGHIGKDKLIDDSKINLTKSTERRKQYKELLKIAQARLEEKIKRQKFCIGEILLCDRMSKNIFFDDAAKTINLIRQDSSTSSIPHFNFFKLASAARKQKYCIESIYVLPLTDLSIDFFITNNKSDWFDEEKNLSHEVRRIVIQDNISVPRMKVFIKFLQKYQNNNWRIIQRSELRNTHKKYFREYCVFIYRDGAEISYEAFFTYLDEEHVNIFTKGSWTQYQTTNTDYIKTLTNNFEMLWELSIKLGKSIKQVLAEQ
ncbi:toll/interleukin-1 receptor domain-containing protein [Candidatus Thiothrix anitrata]|uniref:Toll/interleukin-1 receptor domain-containing protein n=1 Tax=Candidatus Thiothrix anitrata TaxID=2823902 RepID=A0ABX7X705_9GAMM|nr:toll/interleukin-1 receptor domain-containing protein [Candidatus Thiothrix anitrata]QTR50758.1 toll/interleukin-1 receptor domain-containing protein [Candidatus Thiothrix anitrata]